MDGRAAACSDQRWRCDWLRSAESGRGFCTGCGAFQRSSLTGGAANGMPRNRSPPSCCLPRTLPPIAWMTLRFTPAPCRSGTAATSTAARTARARGLFRSMPPTLVASIYGMNFRFMPELEWRYGYFGALALIGGSCGLLLWRFRKIGWL